jgi:cytosine/uracil/thiamine/allantoin permease
MFNVADLFQWERFITPSIIKIFYWLAVVVAVLFGLSTMASGLAIMIANPLAGIIMVFTGLAGILMSVIFARIISELILIVFRINEHLGALRERGEI